MNKTWKRLIIIGCVAWGLAAGCGRHRAGPTPTEYDEEAEGYTVAEPSSQSETDDNNNQEPSPPGDNSGNNSGDQPAPPSPSEGNGENNDDSSDNSEDDDFDDDFGDDEEDGSFDSACDFPNMCVESADECTDFWEGSVVGTITCSSSVEPVCCNVFPEDGSDSSDEDNSSEEPVPAPSADAEPLTRDEFCETILVCIMPEGSTATDCHDVYDDNYCGDWPTFLSCMNPCSNLECNPDGFSTQFILCEAECFNAYCE
jgi:hypothetical protein